MTDNLGGNYWDWVSAQEHRTDEDVEDFGEIITEAYDTLKPHLDSMVWPECNTLYLNQIYRIPQRTIGGIIGISQYGVSKRLRTAIRRLKMKLKTPEHNISLAKQELSVIFSPANLPSVMCYYFFNSSQMANFLRNKLTLPQILDILELAQNEPIEAALRGYNLSALTDKDNDYQDIVAREEQIRKTADKYLPYFLAIFEITTIGESTFKNNEQTDALDW